MASDVTGLLDTNIFVDILREYPAAVDWMAENASQTFAIPSLVRMELVRGARDKKGQRDIVRLLKPYPILYPTEADARWALQQFEIYHLSHQVEGGLCPHH